MNNINNISKGTALRTILLLVALINQVLSALGKSPLPIESEQTEQFVSLLFTGIAAIAAWWENNSFTKNAIKADELLESLNSKAKESEINTDSKNMG